MCIKAVKTNITVMAEVHILLRRILNILCCQFTAFRALSVLLLKTMYRQYGYLLKKF